MKQLLMLALFVAVCANANAATRDITTRQARLSC